VVRRRSRVDVSRQTVPKPHGCPTRGTGKHKGAGTTFTIAPITTSLKLQLTLYMPGQPFANRPIARRGLDCEDGCVATRREYPWSRGKSLPQLCKNQWDSQLPSRVETQTNPLQLPVATGLRRAPTASSQQPSRVVRTLHPVMILPQVHLRKPCYDFYFL
jgi:hypothetical protein